MFCVGVGLSKLSVKNHGGAVIGHSPLISG